MYYKVNKMNDNVLIALLSTLGAGVLGVFGMTTKKVNKDEFDKHCDQAREDKNKMYDKLNSMSNEVTEIHTILKERLK